MTHPDVLEAAVIGQADEDQLVKPRAYVVTKAGVTTDAALAEELQQHVKIRLAPYKYPRWVEFSASCRRRRPARSSASNCAPGRRKIRTRCKMNFAADA